MNGRRAGAYRCWGILLAIAAVNCVSAATPAADRSQESAPPTIADLVARADQEVKAGRIFEAIATLERAVQAAPSRADIRIHLATLEKQRGMWLRSAEQYKAVLAANPSNIDAGLGYGELLLTEYQFRAAGEQFQSVLALKLEPVQRDRALVGLGSAQYARGNYSDAIDTYRLLLARKPDEPTALAFVNIALRKSGDLDGAIEGWRRFLLKQPEMGRAKVHLAEAEQLRTAIVRQKAIVAAHPGDAGSLLKLGELLRQQPDLTSAATAMRSAVAARPEDSSSRMRLGEILRDAGRFAEAAEQFRMVTRDDSLGPLASHDLAYCERRLGDAGAESAAWRKALDFNPRDAYAYRRYLMALAGSPDEKKEAALLQKAIHERSADPLPRIQYALLARARGAAGESLRALLDALSIEPNDPYAQSELRAALALRSTDSTKVLAEIEAAGAKAGDARVTALRKAAVLGALGREKEAEPLLAATTAGNPGDVRSAVALALCRRTMGAPLDGVVAALERARDQAPGYLHARLSLATTLLAVSRFSQATAEAEEAVKLAPDDPHALAILGACLRGVGDDASLARALSVLRRAADLDPMESSGATRFLLAKVAWQLGREDEAKSVLRGDLPVDPGEMYRIAWEAIRDNYFDRTFNGQNWSEWRARFEGKLETESDALGAIALMLSSLDNRDTRLRSADQTANLFFTERSMEIQRDAMGKTATTSRTVATSTMDGNVGYLAVSNMSDPKLVSEVRHAMGEMKEKDAVILDLRGNLGGSEGDVQEITSMLVKPGTPTGTVRSASGTQPTMSHGEDPPMIPDKPVVVLVDRNTGSSAEALAGELKESKRAVIVGEPTYGKAGIQFPTLLPDGTTLLVAVAENGDLSGKRYTGVGIVPDVHVDGAMPATGTAKDAALTKAKELLSKERGKRRVAPDPAPTP